MGSNGLQRLVPMVVISGIVAVAAAPLRADDTTGLENLLATRSVSEWTEVTVDTVRDVGTYLDVAVVPGTGVPFMSYYEKTAADLWIAHFVGSGGNCGPGNAWSCQVLDATGDVGSHNSIAVRESGSAVQVLIAYHDATNGSLKVARGTCEGTSCNLTVSTVQSGSPPLIVRGRYASAAMDPGGWPFIAYQVYFGTGDETVRVAYRNLLGTGNCGVGDAAGDWQCDNILSAPGIGAGTDILVDALDRLQIAFYDPVTGYPYHAVEIGSGGNCGPNNSWFCRTSHINTHDCGRSISLMAESDGTPHLAFVDETAADVVYASYVGSAGNCGFSSVTMQFEWQCDVIDDNVGNVGTARSVGLTADAAGEPLLAFRDASSTMGPSVLRFAQPYHAAPAGAVPNCGPNPGLFYTWVCTTMDSGGAYQEEAAAVAISASSAGTAIAYHELDTYAYPEEGNLKVLWQQLPFFYDGFQSGTTGGWSLAVP